MFEIRKKKCKNTVIFILQKKIYSTTLSYNFSVYVENQIKHFSDSFPPHFRHFTNQIRNKKKKMKAIHVAKKKIREKKCMNLFLQKFYGFFHASLEMALNVAKDFLITKTFLRVLHMSLMMVSKIQKPNEWQRELSRF